MWVVRNYRMILHENDIGFVKKGNEKKIISEICICLPGCEFNNSPISVDPLLHEVTNKVLTKTEVIFWDSSKYSGMGNVIFPLNISKDTFINKTNTRLTPWTSIWFVLVFVMVIRVIKFSWEGYKFRNIFAYKSTYHRVASSNSCY